MKAEFDKQIRNVRECERAAHSDLLRLGATHASISFRPYPLPCAPSATASDLTSARSFQLTCSAAHPTTSPASSMTKKSRIFSYSSLKCPMQHIAAVREHIDHSLHRQRIRSLAFLKPELNRHDLLFDPDFEYILTGLNRISNPMTELTEFSEFTYPDTLKTLKRSTLHVGVAASEPTQCGRGQSLISHSGLDMLCKFRKNSVNSVNGLESCSILKILLILSRIAWRLPFGELGPWSLSLGWRRMRTETRLRPL